MPRFLASLFPALVLAVAPAACGPTQNPPAAQGAGVCLAHGVPEVRCPFCHPGLVESLGPCAGHGVLEAYCYQCTAALLPGFRAVGDWCPEHDRPESQCYLCNPGLDPARHLAAEHTEVRAAIASGALVPEEIPRSRRPPAVHCSTSELIVRLEGAEVPEAAGFRYAVAERLPLTSTLVLNAEVVYPADRHARLASAVPGVTAEVRHDLGDVVGAGEVLAVVASPALGAAKSAYLRALAAGRLWEQNHARNAKLRESGVVTEKELLQTETDLAEARIAAAGAEQELLALGLTREQVEAVVRDEDTGTLHRVVAPFPGIVVDRGAVVGEVVDPSAPLFSVADVSRMWALVDVYETEAREIRVGQPVVVRADALPGEAFAGRITWVSSAVDPRTRTLRVRAELENPEGRLKANMFAEAAVSVRETAPAVVVPKAAVQWEGCCNVVFVRESDTVFSPHKVLLGADTGTVYEVLSGLDAGEKVVTQGSFLLKTELLKGSIGAGCCELRPGS